jgi:Trk K+ transport system NAD-binding subunit
MRQKERVMVIRIRRKEVERDKGGEPHVEDELIAIPDGATELRDGDVLSVIGSEAAVARLGTEE